MEPLVTRHQFIEEAKKNFQAGQEQVGEYGDCVASRGYLQVAQTAALIVIADALDKLLLNGIMVEKP